MLTSLPITFILTVSAFVSFVLPVSPPGPVVGPVPGVWCVWSDSSSMLRFCPGTDSLTLTVRQAAGSCPQDGITILRDRLGDQSILKLVRTNHWEHLYLKSLL